MTDLLDQIRTLVQTERTRFSVPGCAVVIVKDGEVLLCEGFGQRDVDADLPVTAQTLFPIGSSTKTFTAAVCASLVDEGLLDFDKPVRDYLPGFALQDPVATQLLSIRDCLSHRSGLPRHDILWYAGDGILSRDDIIAALPFLPPTQPFRQTWQYNNLMYITAGHLAGRLSGGSYEDAVRERILTPLGMTRTNFDVAQTQADADFSRPYVRPGGEDVVKQVPFASLNLAGPAGNINSCVQELASWLTTLLGQGVAGKDQLLSDSVLDQLRTLTMPMPTAAAGAVRTVGYGLALVLDEYRGKRVTHHGGNIDGFSSQVLTVPAEGIGIAVLTNLGGTPLRDVLPYLLLDLLDGIEDGQAHGEIWHAKLEALTLGAEQAKEANTASGLPPVRPLADYAGTYHHAGYGQFVVSQVGQGLAASYLNLARSPLEHRRLEVFDLLLQLDEQTRIPLQFTHNLLGDVDGVRVLMESSTDPITFARQANTAHLTDAVLDALAGSYRMGPITVLISRRGTSELVACVEGGPSTPLVPIGGRAFMLGGGKVDFADDGSLTTPMGTFTRS